ncbi:hypothetical protein [Pararhizobium sp. IMCC21322]|uniref:hypothetical protein n=1 Tax=Pararhizobium sp. IMCC21322 TaxID=3067903 RepID=UPI0027413F62|nr:hypothetical protein [Pararhizobium sp. IMCC21322]
MTDKTMFTELDQYQWYRDIDELTKTAKIDRSRRRSSDIPLAPLSLVLTILEDMVSRPEVVAVWGSPYVDGHIAPEERFLLTWFNDYLLFRYGNETTAVVEAQTHVRDIATGVYSGVDDSKLRAELLAECDVYDDAAAS